MRHRSPLGSIMISTPTKPMVVALQRRQPTCSPSIGMASTVISSGATAATA
jgi:hypothetical protein